MGGFQKLAALSAAVLLLLSGAALIPGATPSAGAQAGGPVDVAGSVGIKTRPVRTYSVNVNDHNSDGKKDVMIVRHGPQHCCPNPRLYENLGKKGSVLAPTALPGTWDNKD